MGAAGTAGKVGITYASRMWIAKRDDNGYAKGIAADPNSVVSDTVYSAYLLDTTVDFTPGEDVRPIIDFMGAQTKNASATLPNIDPGDVVVNLNSIDETFDALVIDNSVDTDAANVTITSDNPRGVSPPFIVGFQVAVTNFDTLRSEFYTIVYLNCKIKKSGPPTAAIQTGDAQNPANVTYTITPSLSTRTADGRLFSDTSVNNDGDVGYSITYRANKPFHLATWIADGTETDFDLPYLPTTDDATGADRNLITLDGTQSTVTSVNTTTGNVVVAAAGSDGDIWQVLFTTDYDTA